MRNFQTQTTSPKSTAKNPNFFQNHVHYDRDLEMAILGACMIENTSIGRIYKLINGLMFYWEGHTLVWGAIASLWASNEPTDIISVYHRLVKDGILEIEGENVAYFVTKMTRFVTSTASLEYHAMILRTMYVQREMIKLTNSGIGEKDGAEAIAEISAKIAQLQEKVAVDTFIGMDEVVVNLVKHMDDVKGHDLTGVTTGFKRLNLLTGGFQKGGMYIIGARPSVGKSAFMGRIVFQAASAGYNVGVVSLEMTDNQIAARISSLVTDIDYWRIYRNRLADEKQAEYFYRKVTEISELPIMISDKASMDIGDIKASASRLKKQGKLDVLFIDYLQLLESEDSSSNTNREQQVSKISRGLKLLAKDYDIPVIVLAQLNRLSEQSADKKPKLHNLRESGSLEQDSDGVIFLHRDWMSGIKEDENGQTTEHQADIIIAKWRDGEVGEYKIGFDGAKMKFYELDEATNNNNFNQNLITF